MKPEQLEQLTAYLDGELSAAEHLAVKKLLERDPEARQLLEELKRTSRMVGSLPRGKAPADMSALVMARLEREALLGVPEAGRPKRVRSIGWIRPLGVAAGIMMMLTAGWLIYRQNQPKPEAPRQLAMADRKDYGAKRTRAGREGAGVQPASRTETFGKMRREGASEASHPTEMLGEAKMTDRIASGAPTAPTAVVSKGAPAARTEPAEVSAGRSAGETDMLAAVKAKAEMRAAVPPSEEASPAQSDSSVMRLGLQKQSEVSMAANFLLDEEASRVPSEGLSNRIELLADADTRNQLVAQVERFMSSNHIPDLRTTGVTAPIQPEQAFYYLKPEKEEKDRATSAGTNPSTEAVEVVLNVQAPQVEQLIESMDQVARANRAKVSWTANAVPVPDAGLPSEVMKQLTTNTQAVQADRHPSSERLAGKATAVKEQAGAEIVMPKSEDRTIASSGERVAKAARGSGPRSREAGVSEQVMKGGGTAARGAIPQQVAAGQDFITLAISFRAQQPLRENAAGIPGKPTVAAPQPTSAPAQSQPAPQGDGR